MTGKADCCYTKNVPGVRGIIRFVKNKDMVRLAAGYSEMGRPLEDAENACLFCYVCE